MALFKVLGCAVSMSDFQVASMVPILASVNDGGIIPVNEAIGASGMGFATVYPACLRCFRVSRIKREVSHFSILKLSETLDYGSPEY